MARRPCSNSNTLMRDLAGLNAPSCSKEQAISHCRHEVHLAGSIKSDFCMGLPLVSNHPGAGSSASLGRPQPREQRPLRYQRATIAIEKNLCLSRSGAG